MKTNRTISVVAAIVLLAGLGQAKAAVLLYSNYGTVKDVHGGGDNVSVGLAPNYGSDNFTLASAATVTGFFGSILTDSSTAPMTSVVYQLGTAENLGDIEGPQTAAVSSTYAYTDTAGFTGWDSTFSIQNWKPLAAGTYWITLGGGSTKNGPGANQIYWNSSTGAGSTSAKTVTFLHWTQNYGSAFSLSGDLVPEPATMSVLVLGGIATLIRRRNRR